VSQTAIQPADPNTSFAKVLRQLREEANISQEQLGFDSGYHRTYIGMMERGIINPTLQTILSVARALKISARDLVALVEVDLGDSWQRPEKKTLHRRGARKRVSKGKE
jgi:transcriptional regulator with XRE-family HTH domain